MQCSLQYSVIKVRWCLSPTSFEDCVNHPLNLTITATYPFVFTALTRHLIPSPSHTDYVPVQLLSNYSPFSNFVLPVPISLHSLMSKLPAGSTIRLVCRRGCSSRPIYVDISFPRQTARDKPRSNLYEFSHQCVISSFFWYFSWTLLQLF